LEAAVIRVATVVLALAFAPISQTPRVFKPSSNPVSDAVRQQLARGSKNLVAAAELMPADKYAFHPTPAQMTFGQLIVHIVQTNVALCSAVGGSSADPAVFKLSDSEPKDKLVGEIKKSFEYCTQAFATLTDAQIGEEVSMLGKPTGQSRADAMVTIAVDWADHYSTAATYLRLNNILPPTAQPQKQP
jgi:DinB superfamily